MQEVELIQSVKDSQTAMAALDDAHKLFAKELYIVKGSFDAFRIVGINVSKLYGPGAEFLKFSQILAQRSFVIGIESLFERKDQGDGLCSVRGLLLLAKKVELKNAEAVQRFTSKYDVNPTGDWFADIENVLAKQRPLIASFTKHTSKIRNMRVAHLAQPNGEESRYLIPSIDDCERIIDFAYDFYVLISSGFLGLGPASLSDAPGRSFLGLLKKRMEITDAK